MPDLQDQAVIQFLCQCGLLGLTPEEQQSFLGRAAQEGVGLIPLIMAECRPDETAVAKALATLFGVSFVDIDEFMIDKGFMCRFGERWWSSHQVLPLASAESKGDDAISLAIADPAHMDAASELVFLAQCRIVWSFAGFGKLQAFHAMQMRQMRAERLQHHMQCLPVVESPVPDATLFGGEDAPAVRLVNGIIDDARQLRASDVHFEPFHDGIRVRIRKDGLLHVLTHIPLGLACRVVARIKVMAHLDVAEKRLPQDGRILWRSDAGHAVDLRVSTCPAMGGECVVMRLHDTGAELPSLAGLGMSEVQYRQMKRALASPYGLILVTGPTGSGKTVSLYAALEALNHEGVNICTVEDPVERILPGVHQVAVNGRLKLGFSQVLRTFLRQDPDIIMVGEIRDPETAEMAFRAAHTGHLVLSTLHANSAILTFARLQQLGIPDYSMVSTLCMVMAQRLVRKLCPHCRVAVEDASGQKIFMAGGCHRCSGGYDGRIGIYELLVPGESLQNMMMSGASAREMAIQAARDGCLSLWDSGRLLVRQGVTSLAELERVLAE